MNKIKILLLALLLCFTACARRTPPPPPPSYIEHTVASQGETLAIISSWYTGDSKNWKDIEAANPGLKATKMRIGDVVQIPEVLVTRDEPLTKKAFQNYMKKIGAKSAPKKEDDKSSAPSSDTTVTQPTTNTDTAPTQDAPVEPAPAPTEAVVVPAPTEAPVAPAEVTAAPAPTEASQAPVVDSTNSAPTPSSTEKTRNDLIDEILSR